jgi:hypothetical protein
MKLQQIKIEYVPEQDRVLVRLAGDDRSEVLLWLTRRCVRLLWPLLVRMAESSSGVVLQAAGDAKQALLEFEHEKALMQADFSRPYEVGGRARPLGSEPILVTRMSAGRNAQDQNVLALMPREGQGVNLALDNTLLHGFIKLLQEAVDGAKWDIKLVLPIGPVPGRMEDVARVLN